MKSLLPKDSDGLAGVTLDQLESVSWALLEEGAGTADSPLRFPVLATSLKNAVDARVLVLRHADRNRRLLRFHTDRRSAKVQQIELCPNVMFVFYDPARKLQLRVTCSANVCRDKDTVRSSWAELSVHTKRAYAQEEAPGTQVSDITNGAPCPHVEDAERGRENFAVVDCTVIKIEWLVLSRSGHRSALVRATDTGWSSTWIMP